MEIWKPVVGYEGYYEVSNIGNVRSIPRRVAVRATPTRLAHTANLPARNLKPNPRGGGRSHLIFRLTKNGVTRGFYGHTLVLEAFRCPRPSGFEARHLNDQGADNRIENLKWGTRSENMQDRVTNGIHWQAKKTECKYGHQYTPENTYTRPDGNRDCNTCRRNRNDEIYRRQRS